MSFSTSRRPNDLPARRVFDQRSGPKDSFGAGVSLPAVRQGISFLIILKKKDFSPPSVDRNDKGQIIFQMSLIINESALKRYF